MMWYDHGRAWNSGELCDERSHCRTLRTYYSENKCKLGYEEWTWTDSTETPKWMDAGPGNIHTELISWESIALKEKGNTGRVYLKISDDSVVVIYD